MYVHAHEPHEPHEHIMAAQGFKNITLLSARPLNVPSNMHHIFNIYMFLYLIEELLTMKPYFKTLPFVFVCTTTVIILHEVHYGSKILLISNMAVL